MHLLAVLSKPLWSGMVRVRGQRNKDLKTEHPPLFLYCENDNKGNNFKLAVKSLPSKTFLLACLYYLVDASILLQAKVGMLNGTKLSCPAVVQKTKCQAMFLAVLGFNNYNVS